MTNIDTVTITILVITHASTTIISIVIVTIHITNIYIWNNYSTHIETIINATIIILRKPSIATK